MCLGALRHKFPWVGLTTHQAVAWSRGLQIVHMLPQLPQKGAGLKGSRLLPPPSPPGPPTPPTDVTQKLLASNPCSGSSCNISLAGLGNAAGKTLRVE